MKISRALAIVGFSVVMLGAQNVFAADNFSTTINAFKKSQQAQQLFDKAYGYAVFPTVGKGAALIGATYAKGKMYRKGRMSGETTLVGLSLGPQLGGEAYSEMIFFKDKKAYDKFTRGGFDFDAKASVNAIAANAKAGTGSLASYASANTTGDTGVYDAGYDNGVAVLIRGKYGLMADASIGGQHFSFKPAKS